MPLRRRVPEPETKKPGPIGAPAEVSQEVELEQLDVQPNVEQHIHLHLGEVDEEPLIEIVDLCIRARKHAELVVLKSAELGSRELTRDCHTADPRLPGASRRSVSNRTAPSVMRIAPRPDRTIRISDSRVPKHALHASDRRA